MYVIPLPVGPVHVTLKVGDPFIEYGVTVIPVTREGTVVLEYRKDNSFIKSIEIKIY